MSKTSDFGLFGRYSELPYDRMTADQKKAYDFTVKERGQVPGPYKIWLQNPKLMEVMVPLGVYFQGHSSRSKSEIEIATNLTNARWLAAYSNYEHEMIAEKAAGLPPEKVQARPRGSRSRQDVNAKVATQRNEYCTESYGSTEGSNYGKA
jgi:4-carboxymuconolactone decarboxylase